MEYDRSARSDLAQTHASVVPWTRSNVPCSKLSKGLSGIRIKVGDDR
jgi:hypothetical protein